MEDSKKANFVFSARNPIAKTLPILVGLKLVELEDFETRELMFYHMELAQEYEDAIRYGYIDPLKLG